MEILICLNHILFLAFLWVTDIQSYQMFLYYHLFIYLFSNINVEITFFVIMAK